MSSALTGALSRSIACLAILTGLSLAGGSQDTRDPGTRDPGTNDPGANDADASEELAKIDRLIERARTGRSVVRPQAARRLISFGEPAAERLLELSGEDNRSLATLGRDLIEVLGELGDARLRKRLWRALGDADFPWRPAAARSLISAATPAEKQAFAGLSRDALAAVRFAALQAFERIDDPELASLVRPRLADANDRVRRQAASLMDRWGEACALYYLLEDLAREDSYFERPTGQLARFDAIRLLSARFNASDGYLAEKSPDSAENLAAIEKITARVRSLCPEAPELPSIARAARATEGDLIGMELRSCRRGEFFLRWNAADVLYVGEGNALRIELAPGSVARLREQAAPLFDALEGRRFWGAPGCDLEQFHWRGTQVAKLETFRLSKGPDSVDGLRPEPLSELARLLLETLPTDGDDPRSADLKQRVRLALNQLGGELESE